MIPDDLNKQQIDAILSRQTNCSIYIMNFLTRNVEYNDYHIEYDDPDSFIRLNKLYEAYSPINSNFRGVIKWKTC